ncbi:hypothetical protein AB0F15_32810 [Amycolatopsis sp. NPDC026612]|uniref:hypothetical protein n=1 Tax=Amycolatopsis sp. NPDC026612 TaxID=3155466 RepID=UPI0034046081
MYRPRAAGTPNSPKRIRRRGRPSSPPPWGSASRTSPFDGIWSGLIVRAPTHRPGHDRALSYWCPKWHGTEERLLDFAAGTAALAPSLTPLPLRAAFEMAMEGNPIWRSRYVQEALDAALPGWTAKAPSTPRSGEIAGTPTGTSGTSRPT